MSSRIQVNYSGSALAHKEASRCAIISKNASKNARAARARERTNLSGHAINGFVRLVLCGIPYRGLRVASNAFTCTQTNQLPTSLNGQAKTPPGGSTAALCNFSRVTHVTLVCKRTANLSCSQLRLPDNNNPATKTQANNPVETPPFLWESATPRPLPGASVTVYAAPRERNI
jgi:hypothetical protein